jgi:uncharacterized protein
MRVPEYPSFAPISLEMKEDLHPALNLTEDGISEFTFSNLYLFRKTYGYRLSSIPGKTFVIEGARHGKSFFSVPCALPEADILDELMAGHDYLKNLPESLVAANRAGLERRGYSVEEDRDNFDYLYDRTDLAELSGKAYHKKRNLVNAFLNSYSYEQKPLSKDNVPDALAVLDKWREAKGFDGDYEASREALELFDVLGMRGFVYYVGGSPAGWCLGESLAKGRMFAVHFEKGIEEYKGIYQFINQAFAQSLPTTIRHINREQDLGDEGLRQAKMTYRPSGFVSKHRVVAGGCRCREDLSPEEALRDEATLCAQAASGCED